MTDRRWSAAAARLGWGRIRVLGDAGAAVADTLVRPGDVVVDAGAFVGIWAARLAQLAGPDGLVHAFEPNPDTRRYLELVAEDDPQTAPIVVHPEALSDREGPATLHVPAAPALGSLAGDGAPTEVSTVTLDAALGADAAQVGFLKIDVEGHELSVLRGAPTVLHEARPRIVVELEQRHAGADLDATFALLAGAGYAGFAIGPDGPFPLADFDLERDQVAHLRPEEAVQSTSYVRDFLFTPA
jgi:FkbM family methyltransferase